MLQMFVNLWMWDIFHIFRQKESEMRTLLVTVFQPLLYESLRDGLPSQRGCETQEASDRADDVGQSERP